MRPDLLHVIVPYFNPIRWQSRSRLHSEFEEHMLDSGVMLTTVECALGDRPFELPENVFIRRVQVRSGSVLWIKENLINLGVQHLPSDWKYMAWVDGDLMFRNTRWAAETVHALQHYNVVQPWEHAYALGPNGGHSDLHFSWARQYHHGKRCGGPRGHPYDEYAHCGYAWATKRRVFNALGGLIDFAILGSADHHMAQAFLGQLKHTTPGGLSPSYGQRLMTWQDRAMHAVAGHLGFVPGTIEHGWHGSKAGRNYVGRWDILRRNEFDPDLDIKRNWQGVWEFSGNKPQLRRDIDHYFRQRHEDANTA